MLAACLVACSTEPTDSSGEGAARGPWIGEPVGLTGQYARIPIDYSGADGFVDAEGTVWFTQSGRVFTTDESGRVSQFFNFKTDSLATFSAGGNSVAWADYGDAYYIDSQQHLHVQRSKNLDDWWSEVAVSPSGLTIAMAQQEGPVRVVTGAETVTLTPVGDAYYRRLVASDDFVYGFNDDSIDVWTVKGKVVARLSFPSRGSVTAGTASGNDPVLATCPEGEPEIDPLEVVDAQTSDVVDRVALEFDPSPYADFFQDCQAIAMDSSSDLVAAGSGAGEVRLWDRSVGKVVGSRVGGENERVTALSMNPRGTILYVETMLEPTLVKHRWQGRRYVVPIARAGESLDP